jgi:hypothetical protein
MTSYLVQDLSAHDGSPFELYKFESDVAPLFYTNNHEPILFAGDWYKPIQIKRGLSDVGGLADSAVTVNVDVSVSSDLFLAYGKDLTPPTLKVTIYKQQRGADGFKRQLVGRCISHDVSGETYTLGMQNLLQTEFNSAIAQVIFDNKCNNIFGDVRCKFNVAASTIDATITGATDFVFTVDATMVAHKYKSGTIGVGSQKRLIIDNDVHTVTIAYPFLREDGVTVCTIAPGCDLSRTQCLSYANVDNFSGFMAIPTANPLATDLSEINSRFQAQTNKVNTSRWYAAAASSTAQPPKGVVG